MQRNSQQKRADSRSTGFIFVGLLLATIPLIFFPFDVEAAYLSVYIACYALLLLGILFCCERYGSGEPSYSPFYYFSVIYLFMFAVCPMYDVVIGQYLWFGYDLFGSGVLATGIASIGYIAFYIAYRNTNRSIAPRNASRSVEKSESSLHLRLFIIAMWLFCFATNVYYMVAAGGNSILYCLSLGLLGEGGGAGSDASLGFISMFSYALPAATLLYCEYGRSRFVVKAVMIYLMLALQVSRGFRFIVIQIIVMFLFYYRLRKGRYPNIVVALLLSFVLVFVLILMTMFRSSVRAGAGMDLSLITMDTFAEAFDDMFWENLRIYQNFYGMVDVIPSVFPFCYADQVLVGTAVMLIPRIIWPSKPSMHGGEGLMTLIGPNIASGQAYPALGEYYYALGVPAVICFMALFAWWMRRVYKRYACSSNPLDNILYVVCASSALQLIIRGYMPSNFWFVIFSILPVVALRAVFKKEIEENQGVQ